MGTAPTTNERVDEHEHRSSPSGFVRIEGDVHELLDRCFVGLHCIDREGTILWANRADYEALEYTHDEFVGHNVREFHLDVPRIEEAFRSLMKGERIENVPARLLTKSGGVRHVLVTPIATFDDGGAFVHAKCLTRDVTDRFILNERLEFQSRRAAVADHAPIGIVATDVAGVLDEANSAFCEMLGYSASELAGKNVYELTHADDRAIEREKAQQILARRTSTYSLQKRFLKKDRSELWVKVIACAIHDDLDGPLRIVFVVENIDHLRRVGEARRKSEQRLQLLGRLAPVGMLQTDVHGTCQYVNDEWSKIAGRAPAEALGVGWRRAIHPDDRGRVLAEFDAATKLGRSFRSEYRILRPDGTSVWVLGSLVETRNFSGDRVFLTAVTDITDRIDGEAARVRLAAIVDSSQDAICLADADGTIASWNRGAEQIFGYGQHEALGRSITDVVVEEHSAELVGCLRRASAGELVHEVEILGRRKDGRTVCLSMSLSAVKHPRTKTVSVAAIFRDTSERKEQERDREALLSDLRRTLNFYNLFIGVLSHDLRNPLGAIMTAADLLSRRKEDEKEQRIVQRIRSSGGRMLRMIEQLLDVTRIRAGKGLVLEKERASLDDICEQVKDELEAAHPGFRLGLETRGDVSGVWDSDRLAQVASNLLGNAIQHSSGSRTVRVLVDGTDRDRVRLSVQNRGTIPRELLPAIFDPFRRSEHASKKTSGLGLGLFITRQIAVAHGGDIFVSSNAQDGTTFVLDLPRLEVSDESSWPRAEVLNESFVRGSQ